MSARWHIDHYERPDPSWRAEDYCPACNLGHEESCDLSTCDRPHIVAFSDAELRARDERIIVATLDWLYWPIPFDPERHRQHADAIIAAAEADQ